MKMMEIDADALIIDGQCYHDGGVLPSYVLEKGFDGRWFHIRRFDGTDIRTNNLRFNGDCPDIPNNAEFVWD